MKKSELKALIREVIEEISNSDITTDGLGSNGFKLANIAGKVFWKKGNLLIYLVKQGNSGEQKWYATTDKVQGDKLPYIPYEKSQVKTMNDILKLDDIVNSKYQVHETSGRGDFVNHVTDKPFVVVVTDSDTGKKREVGFNDEETAMDFKLAAEEDGTYWGFYSR